MEGALKPEWVSRERLRRAAARLHDLDRSGRTYCLPPGRVPDLPLPAAVHALIKGSDTGAVLFWSLAEARLVLPPFPVERESIADSWHAGPLQSLLDRPRTVLVVLLRLGGFAIGVFEGVRLATSKVGSPFVKGRHRAGGSSSARFARRREGQARVLFDKACDTLREQVEAYGHPIEYIVLGGDRMTLQAFEKRCPHLQQVRATRLHRVLDVPDPRLNVLKDSLRLVYSSQVVTFTPCPATNAPSGRSC